MAGRTATLTVKILGDAASAAAALKGTSSQVSGLQSTVQGLAVPAAAVVAGVGAIGVATAMTAAEAEQNFGALDSVFQDSADEARAFAAVSAEAAGLSASEYAQMASLIGAQLKRTGTDMDDLAPSTDSLIQLGADLAAQFGGPTSDAVAAIGSLMRGERDPIERYAVGINEAAISAYLAEQGLSDLEGEALNQAKAQATLALLFEQTADAQGAFAREADTASGSLAIAEANMEDASAELGTALLPALATGATLLADFAKWVKENSTLVLTIVGIVGGFAAVILAVNAAMAAYAAVQAIVTAATSVWTGVQWLLNAALVANPIGIVVAAIVALVAIIVVAYNKSETFRNIVDGVFKAVTGFVTTAVDTIKRVFSGLFDILTKPFKMAQEVIGGIMDGVSGFLEILPGGQAAGGGGTPATAGLRGARALGRAAVPGGSVPGRDRLRVEGSATITHRIEDPHGALANLPGGAAAVAAELAKGTNALPLFRNLQHAAGVR
jgi:phage-related protein